MAKMWDHFLKLQFSAGYNYSYYLWKVVPQDLNEKKQQQTNKQTKKENTNLLFTTLH